MSFGKFVFLIFYHMMNLSTTIVDEDVLSDLIVIDRVHLLSIEALMHMTELVATRIVAHRIASD